MIKGLKICGVSDPKTLNYILNHNHKPTMIGFITNYEKSKRFVEYEKLKNLINVDKKKVNFVPHHRSHISLAFLWSKFPVGSSAKIISGEFINALEIATL